MYMCMCLHVCVCVCVCVRACVRECVRACVRACVRECVRASRPVYELLEVGHRYKPDATYDCLNLGGYVAQTVKAICVIEI